MKRHAIIHLVGYGEDVPSSKFHSIWAERSEPSSRQWWTEGSATGFRDNETAISQMDSVMQNFMKTTATRQAQVAVGKNGEAILGRAYTWSVPEKPTAVLTDQFLLASLSKMFCEAAIQQLFDEGVLNPTTRPWSRFVNEDPWSTRPRDPPNQPADHRLFDITVQQLLDHQGVGTSVNLETSYPRCERLQTPLTAAVDLLPSTTSFLTCSALHWILLQARRLCTRT
jgi:CubicO group peptidase (beta-lactamase class C family)